MQSLESPDVNKVTAECEIECAAMDSGSELSGKKQYLFMIGFGRMSFSHRK